ncbi:MAG: DUF2384 domain-containing protein, partial [Acidobacteria bacterium]|nr:DUF2384 domain-containing protein [Acidobacteriota bacterium]
DIYLTFGEVNVSLPKMHAAVVHPWPWCTFGTSECAGSRYIGDNKTATRWLRRPNRSRGGSTPLQLIDTELGARAVENVLGRIAYGGVS